MTGNDDGPLDTHAFERGGFPAHGRVRVHYADRVLHFEAEGPFNVELMLAFERAMVLCVHELPADNRYVDLVEFRHSALMTDEAWARFENFVQAAVQQGFRSRALVLVMPPELEAGNLLLPRLRRVWRDAPQFLVVETLAAARQAIAALRAAEAW